ncbi:protoheme IX biogenesis protein HemY [Erwinia persicina]|uniref:protoheme IX biogenesis protein HemY n=1 Tax=Erwinia persicina TaxID=55211 RepID=UPI00177B719B|nr:protoheme IX biogenesis protein HemY [Erwinia persicina]MBD8165445.1 protoheme IX biogenesis protein HemY [Erwinia persicina]MBD8216785.1 protoheme IX biogenesis protein HemY [Erwinia persicina]
MLKVLLLFLLCMAGIVLGPLMAGHQGYVLIRTDNWDIKTSVTAMVIMMVLAMIVILAIEWLLRRLFRTGARTRGWFNGRKRRSAHKQTNAALIKLAEGDYQQVEKLLSRHADHAEQPVVNYLLAAEAAQQRGDEIRANQHLERATELNKGDPLPVEITRVRIQLARNEDHAARHGIDRLLEIAPRHPEVLRLAEQAYLRTHAWSALLDILPAMEKIRLGDEAHRLSLQQQAWLGLMSQAMADQGSDGLKRWWQNQSRKTRQEPALQVAMADHLIVCDDHDTAQQIVLEGLKRQYDERLVLLMPRLKTGNPEQLEKALRQQIKQHGATPLLHSTLGQLLMQHGEWEQAEEAFRAALQQRPDAFDYAWLADTLDRQHKPEEAATMRRDGLLLTLKNNP